MRMLMPRLTRKAKLDLVVSVDNRRWKIGDPFLAKLRVHNPGKVPVQGICSFALTDPLAVDNPYKEGRNLWAPVIVQEGGVQPAPGPVASVLKPGQTIELEVDLNKLNWASAISNLWPANPISRSGYEAGDYDFSFRIHVTTQETAEKMESNRIKVSIK